mgnify:CR=1 FL=1
MKVGDIVGWVNHKGLQPLAMIIEKSSSDSEYHSRIRVQWLASPPPVQALTTSVAGKKVSTWLKPSKFKIVSTINVEEDV